MDYFTPIEGGQAIIYCKPGTYRQTSLFTRGGKLYAKYGTGFVKVFTHGGTSHPSVKCDPTNIDLSDTGLKLEAVKNEWRVQRKSGRRAA